MELCLVVGPVAPSRLGWLRHIRSFKRWFAGLLKSVVSFRLGFFEANSKSECATDYADCYAVRYRIHCSKAICFARLSIVSISDLLKLC